MPLHASVACFAAHRLTTLHTTSFSSRQATSPGTRESWTTKHMKICACSMLISVSPQGLVGGKGNTHARIDNILTGTYFSLFWFTCTTTTYTACRLWPTAAPTPATRTLATTTSAPPPALAQPACVGASPVTPPTPSVFTPWAPNFEPTLPSPDLDRNNSVRARAVSPQRQQPERQAPYSNPNP